jgi:galactokinase
LALGKAGRFHLSSSFNTEAKSWLTYVEGMLRSLTASGVAVKGMDLLIGSTLPLGSGLSSSSALEVAIGFAACAIAHHDPGPLTIVSAAHGAETNYVGTKSGIMDPYVSVFGKKDFCLLLDCRNLESQNIPLPLRDYALVITDTQVKHELSSSQYNKRRTECEQGVGILQQSLSDVKTLRDVTVDQFASVQHVLPLTLRSRCKHVITENARTLETAQALSAGDLRRVGILMFESHESLRRDFDVTSPELDLLVDAARTLPYVAGSRMTGGGFGGCTITLVSRNSVSDFCEAIRLRYYETFDGRPKFMVAAPSDGAHELLQ